MEQHWSESGSDANEQPSNSALPEAAQSADTARPASSKCESPQASDEHESGEAAECAAACSTSSAAKATEPPAVQSPQTSTELPIGHNQLGHSKQDPDLDAEEAVTRTGEVDEAYVMAYLGRHMCPQEVGSSAEGGVCGGAMTPVGVHGDTYACNMCGFERSESERIAELARTFQAVSDEAQQAHVE